MGGQIMPTVIDINTQTGEKIEREMTAAELKQWKLDNEESKKHELDRATKAAEKAALLAKLGITDEEAKLLLS
jgi:hypothetical protein